MGDVHRAFDTLLQRDVAIKALPSTVGDDSALLTRLQHEARMLAALNHPNIAVIHDLEEWAGGSFLVLELVEGDTLDVRLQRTGPLPVIEALTIGVQVAAALQAAHARGITHGHQHGKVRCDVEIVRPFVGEACHFGPVRQPLEDDAAVCDAGQLRAVAVYPNAFRVRGYRGIEDRFSQIRQSQCGDRFVAQFHRGAKRRGHRDGLGEQS